MPGLEILLDVANQTAVAEQKFSYLPPTIDMIDDEPFVIADVPTTGTDDPITLTGSNFGVLGPVVTIGGVQVPLLDFDHNFVSFRVPEGQGANLPIVVDVSGQLPPAGSAFLSYAPPRVTSYWPLQLSGDTRGGEPITLMGHNFGLVTGNWKLAFTRQTETVSSGRRRLASAFNEVLVTPDLIVEWNHTYVEFITPPGQGQNRTLNFTVGGQVAEFPSTTLSFSYKPPTITGYQPTTGLVTEGGVVLTIVGTSFGVSNAVVTILDPLANSTNDRMTPKLCELLTQDHEQITCKLPAGVGGDLELNLNVDDSSDTYEFGYDPPVIDFFWSSSGGSAAGGEELRIYGQNFGSYRTPAEIYIDDTLCEGSLWLADDRVSALIACTCMNSLKNWACSSYLRNHRLTTCNLTCAARRLLERRSAPRTSQFGSRISGLSRTTSTTFGARLASTAVLERCARTAATQCKLVTSAHETTCTCRSRKKAGGSPWSALRIQGTSL